MEVGNVHTDSLWQQGRVSIFEVSSSPAALHMKQRTAVRRHLLGTPSWGKEVSLYSEPAPFSFLGD